MATVKTPKLRSRVKTNAKKKVVKPPKRSVSVRKKPEAPLVEALPTKNRWYQRIYKSEKPAVMPKKLPSAWQITRKAVQTLWNDRQLFGGIIVVYGLLNLILVRGMTLATDVTGVQNVVGDKSGLNHLATGVSAFTTLITGSVGGSAGAGAGAYQMFLLVMTSLALVWALRQVLAGEIVRVRDAFYKGMYPLVPSFLILCLIVLQCVPLAVGSFIYGTIIANFIAITILEKVLWALVFIAFASVSFYLISSSLFAAYIVTLPDMTPMKALRSARKLVRFRRLSIIRKVLFLVLIIVIVSAVVVIPIALTATNLAPWFFFALTLVGVAFFHSYLYTLYRELLA